MIHATIRQDGELIELPRMKNFQMQTAKRPRVCDNCRLEIPAGEQCLRFTYGSSYYKVTANLCKSCILNMLHLNMPNG